MKSIILAAATLAFGLAVPAMAQDDPAGNPAKEEFTTANVMPDDPFGDINIEPTTQVEAVANTLAALTDGERQEIAARCKVIVDNDATYTEETVAFCKAVGTP